MEVAVIKPELVNEITFEPTINRRTKDIESPYSHNFRASVSVKVGNVVKELTLQQNSEYHCSEYNDADYKEGWTEEWSGLPKNNNPFQDLIDAGMPIDLSEIIAQYDEKVVEAKSILKEIEEKAEAKRVAELKEKFKTCWVNTLQSVLEAEKNKTIIAKKSEITIVPCTEKYYIKNGRGKVTFEYRNFSTNVEIADGKYEWQYVYEYNGEVKDGKKLGEYRNISKRKRLKYPMTALLKFTEAVDDFILTRNYQSNRDNEEYLKRKEKAKLLSEISGYPVTITKKTKWSRDRHNHREWVEYSYLLITKVPKDKYSDFKGIDINTETDTKYVDGKWEEFPNTRTFSVGNFRKLSKEQFKGILDILLKDKKVFPPSKNEKLKDKIES